MIRNLSLSALSLFLLIGACGEKKSVETAETVEKAEKQDKSYPKGWNYDSDWEVIAEECGKGQQQSPINIEEGTSVASNKTLSLGYDKLKSSKIKNKKYAVDVIPTEDNLTIEYNGSSYNLLQFHFHADSEHTVEGKTYPLEVHFVHQNKEQGDLTVLGIFFKEGEHNTEFQKILDNAPEAKQKNMLEQEIDVTAFLPNDKSFYSYPGSLTTPGCNEIVNWVVFKEPVSVSAEQIAAFLKLRDGKKNNRLPQPLNNRTVNFTAN